MTMWTDLTPTLSGGEGDSLHMIITFIVDSSLN
jgi:hypothetical protein